MPVLFLVELGAAIKVASTTVPWRSIRPLSVSVAFKPEKVAELLILRHDMPRSLTACMQEVTTNLRRVANDQSIETLRRAGRLRADLEYARIDEILATGLHAFLTQFLDRVADLGYGISRDFLVPV